MKKMLLILAVMLVIFTGKNDAGEFFSDKEQVSEVEYRALNVNQNKVYFSCDQITLSDEGIYVLVPDVHGNFIRLAVRQLQHDVSGLFITLEDFQKELYNNRRCEYRMCERCDAEEFEVLDSSFFSGSQQSLD